MEELLGMVPVLVMAMTKMVIVVIVGGDGGGDNAGADGSPGTDSSL